MVNRGVTVTKKSHFHFFLLQWYYVSSVDLIVNSILIYFFLFCFALTIHTDVLHVSWLLLSYFYILRQSPVCIMMRKDRDAMTYCYAPAKNGTVCYCYKWNLYSLQMLKLSPPYLLQMFKLSHVYMLQMLKLNSF